MEFGDDGPYLDTVKALHQTIVSLRTALEQSRFEIDRLKEGVWPVESVEGVFRNLAIENHILRRHLIFSSTGKCKLTKNTDAPVPLDSDSITTNQQGNPNENNTESKEVDNLSPRRCTHTKVPQKHVTIVTSPSKESDNHPTSIEHQKENEKGISLSLDSLPIPTKDRGKLNLSLSKTISFSNISQFEDDTSVPYKSNLFSASIANMTENTRTPEVCETSPRTNSNSSSPICQEAVVTNITQGSTDSRQIEVFPQIRGASSHSNLEQNEEVDDIELIFTTDETNESDFKEELVPIESNDSNNHLLQCSNTELESCLSDRELDDEVFQESENPNLKRENSQLYDSMDNSINHEENKSLKSCYSYQDSSFENKSMEKDESFDRFEERVRIIETDISKCGIIDVEYSALRRNTCPNPLPYRPIIHREAISRGLNIRKGRPVYSYSNNARRESGAQTDISALPNSSWRSESSLAHKVKVGDNFTTLPSKFPLPGSRLRLSEKTSVEARRVLLSDIGFTSMVPELSRSADHLCPGNAKPAVPVSYGQFLKTTDLYSPSVASHKFTWTTTASPSDASQSQSRYSSMYPLSPLAPSRRCSAPVSPSRRMTLKNTPSRVRFANGSLPELRSSWASTGDSGDSTDSLVEEAESFLRRSIDCIASGRDAMLKSDIRMHKSRRSSAPEPAADNVPPQDWQPFLPRVPRDLHLDYWVKVIVSEGRVRGGRVRYVGPLLNQSEVFVGVQLSTPDGHSDGTISNRRYFNCEPHHGIFVPFKKVVMGWRP